MTGKIAGYSADSTDLSMHSQYVQLLGFTQTEVEHYCANHLQNLATYLNLSLPDLLAKIQY